MPPHGSIDQRQNKPTPTNKQRFFIPGQRSAGTRYPQGGGGPENAGARTEQELAGTKFQNQPSWAFEFENDFIGFAGPSRTPHIAGIPANNFRALGDDHGGRG